MQIDPRLKPFIQAERVELLDLRGCDLSGLDLSHIELSGALLIGASLRGTDLSGASLIGAQLMGADLTDARLWGAQLSFAHLQGALLVRTDLRGAGLAHASLEGAVVRDVSLEGASISRLPSAFLEPQPKGGWLTLRDGWCCRTFEWREHLSERGARRPPVIALHGMTGSGRDFELLAEHLDRPLISLDLYGHGETPWCRVDEELKLREPLWSPAQLSFDEHLTLTERWLRELLLRHLTAGQPFELLGYSMGGRLALSLVERWDRTGERELLNRLTRLSLIGVNPGLEEEELRAQRRELDGRWAARFYSEPLDEVLRDWEAQPVLSHLRAVNAQLAERLHTRRARQHGEGLAYAMQAVSLGEMPSLWARLEQLNTPTQWISGARDEKFTALSQRAASLQGPPAASHVIEGSGHSPQLERPEEVAALFALS